MNDPQDRFLVDAFFDAPGLLAVRFSQRGDNRLATFAAYRRPDVTPASNAGSIIKVVGVGILITAIGFPLLRGCMAITSSAGYPARPVIVGATQVDSRLKTDWSNGLLTLADDLRPTRLELRPWMVRTLLDVPREMARRGDLPSDWLQPRCTDQDTRVNRQGSRLAETLESAGAGNDLAVILDLPGPAAVAAAAGMASRFDPVFTMDNLPHPNGVVPSEQTLAAAIYWRSTFLGATDARLSTAPAVFVLEGESLAHYANEVERFDNRSAARLPDANGFKTLGVGRILYVRQSHGGVAESDDLNVLFTELAAAGIEIKHLALDTLDEPKELVNATNGQRTPAPVHQWFWHNYGWYRPGGSSWGGPTDPDASYRTTPRPTLFSRSSTPLALDGGLSHRESAFTRLKPTPSPASGGSWLRSSFHSSSG